MFDRQQIIDVRPWLKNVINHDSKLGLVLSPDLDGWMSGLLLTSVYRETVFGLYNNRQLVINQIKNPSECIFVDHDVMGQDIISIGHHITSHSISNSSKSLYNSQGLQINDMFGVSFKSRNDNDDFYYKYPYSTIIFLLFLLDYDVSKLDRWQRFLLMLADGAINSVSNFAHSTKAWQERMFGNYLKKWIDYDDIQDLNLKFRALRKKYIPSEGQGKGTEKAKTLDVVDGKVWFTTNPTNKKPIPNKKNPPIEFIKAIGAELGLNYEEDLWQCWESSKLIKFDPRNSEKSPATNFKKLIKLENLMSLIFSDSTGKIDYTVSDDYSYKLFSNA